MSGSNLVILAETSHKLLRGQAHDWRPHEQTQAIPDNNTLRPKLASGKNEQIAAHRGDFDSCVIITDNIREKIQWWELHVHNVMRNVLVHHRNTTLNLMQATQDGVEYSTPKIRTLPLHGDNSHMMNLSYTSTSKC